MERVTFHSDMYSVVDFNPLSTNPARLQPISYLTRLKFKVTTLKVLTRLHNLGCNPIQVATPIFNQV